MVLECLSSDIELFIRVLANQTPATTFMKMVAGQHGKRESDRERETEFVCEVVRENERETNRK